jgi:hypothetical protein
MHRRRRYITYGARRAAELALSVILFDASPAEPVRARANHCIQQQIRAQHARYTSGKGLDRDRSLVGRGGRGWRRQRALRVQLLRRNDFFRFRCRSMVNVCLHCHNNCESLRNNNQIALTFTVATSAVLRLLRTGVAPFGPSLRGVVLEESSNLTLGPLPPSTTNTYWTHRLEPLRTVPMGALQMPPNCEPKVQRGSLKI